MSDENPTPESAERSDSGDFAARVTDVATTSDVSRRTVLRGGASALATGSLLTASAADAAALPHAGDELNVRTTDVQVLDDASQNNDGEVQAVGDVSGMSNYDCERCEVGAYVRPAGGHEWHGGLQMLEHTHRDSFRVGVTLAGLHPGAYECRLCACPITEQSIFLANIIVVVLGRRTKRRKKKKKRTKKKKEKRKKKHKKKKKHEKHKKHK